MTSDERAEYLASGSGQEPEDHKRLDRVRSLMSEDSTWADPPHDVEEAVLDTIRGEVRVRSMPPGRRWTFAAGAVAALAIVALGLVALLGGDEGVAVSLEGTALEAGASAEATVGSADSGWWVRLDIEGLPPAPEGSYYEGWVWSDDGDGVSIGTFHLRDGDDPVTLWSGVDPAEYPAIWVTLEDADGDPSASDRIVLVGRPGEA